MGLLLHCGCELVEPHILKDLKPPVPKSDTHVPLKHWDLYQSIVKAFDRTGHIDIVGEPQIGLSHDAMRCFGFLDIITKATQNTDGVIMDGEVKLQAVFRNANDFAFPANFSASTFSFACDNLAFSTTLPFGHPCGEEGNEWKGRKHTKFILDELPQLLDDSIARLIDDADLFEKRYPIYKDTKMNNKQMHDIVCRSLDVPNGKKNVITTTFVEPVLREWYEPTYREYTGRTAWSAFSAFTSAGTKGTVKRPIPINEQAIRTKHLHDIFDDFCGVNERIVLN